MHICMVIPTPMPPEEGISNHVYYLSKELMRMGHDVTIITKQQPHSSTITNLDGMNIIRSNYLPIYPFHIITHRLALQTSIKRIEQEIDLVHIHSPLTPFIDTKVPVLSTIHSSLLEDIKHMEAKAGLRSYCFKAMAKTFSYISMREVINKSNTVMTVSRSAQEEILRYYGHKNSIIVGNGVDTVRFQPSPTSSAASNYILYVGRLSYRKGLMDLLEAMPLVLKEHDIDLMICGKGELEKRLVLMTKQLNIENKVKFIGHASSEQLVELYRNALLFVSPSRYETGPLTVLEAMSCGTPVISTNVGIVPDIIDHGVNGLIVPQSDPKQLAFSISSIINNKSMLKKMGALGRETIEKEYSWKAVATRVMDCYVNTINAK